MKTKNFVIISFVCLLQLSCGKTPVKKIIDNGDYRYWRIRLTETCDDLYYFDDDGKWTIFEGRSKEPFTKYTDFEEYDGGDYLLYKKWKLVNDSTIKFNGQEHNISIINDTVMILKFTRDKDSCYSSIDTLYAVPRERIPEKFRKKYHFNKRNFILL